MTDDLIGQIQTFTLAARTALEAEAGQQLEGIYGWLPDGTFGSGKGYPALEKLDEARETRQRLEQFAEDEKAAGLDSKSARRKLIRETAFTWLNRLAAFRLMEERKLLKQTVVRLAQSNGFIFWLTDEETPQGQQAYAFHQQGALPLNAMGEGPSDVAYRRFLLWQCSELARDVSVLFDPDTLASRLCPRPLLLKQLVADMNTEALAEAWKAGNEETVGWLYQAFNSQELQAAFTAARESKKKFEAADIPAVTQLFTIRWVVRFLVENTLGRLWVEMHPDSTLKNELGYLVPVKNSDRALKPVREITFLDPCCGSMHFGLVAFDLYVRMYREEIANTGKPGWPAKASVGTEDEITSSIVENNLFGIDLDLRAVQLSALTLLLRARTQTPKCQFTDQNFACANVEQLTSGRLDELIAATKFGNRAEERILRALAARIADSPNLGSLLRLEKDLQSLVDAERKQMLASTQPELVFSGFTDDLFATTRDLNAFFDELTESLAKRLDAYARTGAGAGHVAHEASKGLRYLRLVQRRYDVVATNPPYLSGRKMNKRLSKLMVEHYKAGKQDLYAAFILRCQELLAPQGLLGMLTMHSYLFTSKYDDMRAYLRGEVAIETLAHFGGGLFAVGNPGTLQTAAVVLRKESDAPARQGNYGLYFRLVRERDAGAKRDVFEAALASYRVRQTHPQIFACQQADFDAIPGKPWSYLANDKIRAIYKSCQLISDLAVVLQGLATTDNKRFLRRWWEIGVNKIAFGVLSEDDSTKSSCRWFPYMKGGGRQKWMGHQECILNWKFRGAEICELVKAKYRDTPYAQGFSEERWDKLIEVWVVKNRHRFFNPGITYSFIGTCGFSARISPGGFVFDVAGSTLFPQKLEDLYYFLCVLNSSYCEFILSQILNPTINYQVGDLLRVPIPNSSPCAFDNFGKEAVRIASLDATESEITYEFVAPASTLEELDNRKAKLRELELKIDAEVSRLYGLTDADIVSIRQELASTPKAVAEDDVVDSDDSDTGADVEESESASWSQQKLAQAWISYSFGAVLGRFQIGVPGELGCGDFPTNVVAEIRKLVDSDGIMASDENHPQDIVKSVLTCLELMLGRTAAHATIRTATGGDGDPEELLRDWIDRQFWKYHLQLYRKRPVYWPLQSPKKKFTVWVFHEQFSKDTLFRVRDQFVQVKINWLNGRIRDLKSKVLSTDTRERRAAEKEISQLSDVLDDVQEFAERLKRITERGYTPHIDDGVLLNAAPLWELLPAWKDAEKAWTELAAGDYDWAQQAMEYRPAEVREKCKTNKSFAIAHGLA